MALIKCKNCGNFISDKAKACPKCGAPNIPSPTETNEDAKFQSDEKENTGHAINPEDNSPQQEDYYYPDQAPKPSHKKLYILLAILIILIAGGIGYYFYAQHQSELKESRLEAERIEQLRQDSIEAARIEAARIEAARLDSIRQDSIFRNFTSNDLRVFELHGKVKEVNYLSSRLVIHDIFKGNKFQFDENGNLINKNKSFHLSEPDGEELLGWKFNKNGYPTEGIFVEEGIHQWQYWEWTSEGQLKGEGNGYGFNSNGHSNEFKYDKNGNLIYAEYSEFMNGGDTTETATVKIDETDKWGNWVKRTITVKREEVFLDCVYTPSESGYQKIDGDRYQNKDSFTFTEQRTITYYDTNEK